MGILDPKNRVMDTVLTELGRRQLSRGGIDISFVAFSDGHTFYEADVVSGSSDQTSRIYFEACSGLPQDQVTLLADDSGRVTSVRSNSNISVTSGKITSGSAFTTDIAELDDQAVEFFSTATRSFGNLDVIGSFDPVFDDENFELDRKEVDLFLTEGNPLPSDKSAVADLSSLPSMELDGRFTDVSNFKFLPPIVNVKGAPQRLGEFRQISVTRSLKRFIKPTLLLYRRKGQSVDVKMDPTSLKKNTITQFFEKNSDGTLTKLDILAARHPDGSVTYFVGKVILTGGTYKFLNVFIVTFG